MKTKSFTELYSEQEHLEPAAVPERLFRLALYPHARLVAGFLRRIRHRHFLADYEFIEDVGYLRSLQDFSLALGSYIEHPDNRGVLRRTFRIRISARRMLHIVRAVFETAGATARVGGPTGDTLEPFGENPTDRDAAASRGDVPSA